MNASDEFKEWVERHCDTPIPLAKMLSELAPGVVPRGVELHEEIQVTLEEDGEEEVAEQTSEICMSSIRGLERLAVRFFEVI